MTDDVMGGIHAAMVRVMDELANVEKRRVQTFAAFNVDDVYAAVKPVLVKHGISIVPNVRSIDYEHGQFAKGTEFIDARVVMGYRLYHEDGSYVELSFAAEGRDTQDKATNKAAQQALKYALVQTFLITVGDPEQEADPGGGDRPVPRQRSRQPAAPPREEPTASVTMLEAAEKIRDAIDEGLPTKGNMEDVRKRLHNLYSVMERFGVWPRSSNPVECPLPDHGSHDEYLYAVALKPLGAIHLSDLKRADLDKFASGSYLSAAAALERAAAQ